MERPAKLPDRPESFLRQSHTATECKLRWLISLRECLLSHLITLGRPVMSARSQLQIAARTPAFPLAYRAPEFRKSCNQVVQSGSRMRQANEKALVT